MENRNNYVLRKLRYALNLRERDIVKIFALDDYEIQEDKVTQFMEKEDTPMFRELSDKVLERFLNGLITFKRGKKDNSKYVNPDKPKRVLIPTNKK